MLVMRAAGLNRAESEYKYETKEENDSPVMCSAGHEDERRSEEPAVGG